jgi:hypothetical protein
MLYNRVFSNNKYENTDPDKAMQVVVAIDNDLPK